MGFTDDARVRDSSSSEWEIGPGPVLGPAEMLCAGMPDLTLTRQVLLIDGPRHADRWVMAGTHTGELLGIPATGAAIRFEGATFTTIDADGMVIEDVHHVDYSTLFAQLGLKLTQQGRGEHARCVLGEALGGPAPLDDQQLERIGAERHPHDVGGLVERHVLDQRTESFQGLDRVVGSPASAPRSRNCRYAWATAGSDSAARSVG